MGAKIHTTVVSHAHPYTRSDTPWIIDGGRSAYGRLVYYLSGGGMGTFGRTVHQEEARRRQRRFVAVFVVLSILWCLFYLF